MKQIWKMLCLAALLCTMTVSAAAAEPLDDIAWENLTYRDIFITNNLAYVDGFNAKTYSPFVQNAGTSKITSDVCCTPPYSLAAFGSPSQQIRSSAAIGADGEYFVASKVYCTRYAAGELGVCIYNTTVGITQVTEDFVTASDIITAEASNRIFMGSIHSADLDGYVDDPVVVNMGIFSTNPTAEELTALYERYVEIEKAREREEILYTEQEMLDAFVEDMNDKAFEIGMYSSVFKDPVGMDNLTTARDLVRLMIYADANYEALNPFWSTESHSMTVEGANFREQTVSCSYYSNPYLEPYYHILAAKGGSLLKDSVYNLAAILEIPDSDDRLAVVALYADGTGDTETGSRAAVKHVADAAMLRYRNPAADNADVSVCCQSAIAVLIPAEGADLEKLQILYEKDADIQRKPASISKILTAVCVLDTMKDLSQNVTYRTGDTDIGGFYVKDFLPGDRVTVEDALYALMVSSSNVTAQALARTEGEVMLETSTSFSGQEMLDAFVEYMNEKAVSLGMTSSSFTGPIGTDNRSTAADLLRLLVHAESHEEIREVWGEETWTVSVEGAKSRQQTVKSTVIKPALENHYHILGGKTGTLSQYNARNLAVILEIPGSDDKLAVVALYADGLDTDADNRFEAARQIADAALKKYNDPAVDNSGIDVCCASAAACLIPAEGADLNDLQILYEKDPDTQRVPASITKVLTVVCALDVIADINETVRYSDFDTQIGTFYKKDFYPGDVLSLQDALYAMLLPSSNVTARMVAREAGKAILEGRDHTCDYTEEVTPPTCTERGYTTYTCTVCGEGYVDDYVAAAGHVYDDDSDGDCNNCGEKRDLKKTRVSGSVKSRRDGAKVTLQGVGETTVQDDNYAFENVGEGSYTLTVKQEGCLTYTVENIAVDGVNVVTLPELQLVAGDVNGDDLINARDIAVFRRDFGKRLENAVNPLTDIDGNGMVNAMDITALRRGFGKSAEKDCTITF